MSKVSKGQKNPTHRRHHRDTVLKKSVDQDEPLGNDNMAMPVGKKKKS